MDAEASRKAQGQLYIQYQARLSPRSSLFQWPENLDLLAAQVGLDTVLFNGKETYPSNDEYDRVFLKQLVKRIEQAIEACTDDQAASLNTEKQDLTVDDAILERYMRLVSMPETPSIMGTRVPSPLYVHHYFPISTAKNHHDILGPCESVTFRQEGTAISQGTTGLTTWEASLRLAAHVVASPHVWQKSDACILELGSGAGFLGLVCARLFDTLPHTDAKLYLTDLEGQVLDRLRETAQLSTST